jgi:hypothetical protein
MATIELFDTRDPADAGRAALDEILNDRDVVVEREALSHALYDAAALVTAAWGPLPDRVASLIDAGWVDQPRALEEVLQIRAEIARATDAAERIYAVLVGPFIDGA